MKNVMELFLEKTIKILVIWTFRLREKLIFLDYTGGRNVLAEK